MKWAAFTRLQHHGSLSLTPKQPWKCKMLIRLHHLTTHKHQSAVNNSVADSRIHFPSSSNSVRSLGYLFCPQKRESVVQDLTTGGKCYHCNPHGRSCWRWCPPPPSRSGLWGTDLGCLWTYEAEFKFIFQITLEFTMSLNFSVILKGLITSSNTKYT